LPGEEDRRPGGIETSGESADAFGDRGAHLGADRTGVTRSAPLGNDAQQRSSGVSTPTTITATATPRQQFVGHDITIAGQLTANGAPVADGVVKLYSDGTGLWHSVGDTTTNERGGFAFRVTQPGAGTRSFKVAYAGSPTHEPSVSDELSVTYVTIPTAITATASPRQQFVGRDVTITGTLTADGTPVAEAPITLFNAADAIERVSIANTTTDASGQYKFTLTATAPSHHIYVVRAPGARSYAPVQSAEISVTYVTIPTTITATASPRQQVVGHDVTITGRLLADGTPVAAAPVILYNADDIIERVSIANTTTDASGDYQFTLTDTAPSHHTYVARSPGDSTSAPVQSAEISVTYVTIPTAITATASQRQQFVGRDVTITGTLTADGTPVAEASVTLYKTDAAENVHVATTTTDAAGHYQFTLTATAPSYHTYVVHAPSSPTHEPSVSDELSVTYVTIPTAITATASPRQQFVGRDVTITGTLTADGTPVAEAPITLFNAADAIERVSIANTTTDASGQYKFTLTATAPSHHIYVVRAPGARSYAPVQSAEISVTYVTIPTTITATASPRQQVVGHDVTITGRLLADGTPVAAAPVILYNADDIIERVSIANTTTDASGYYQFTLSDTAPSHHSYVVRPPGSHMLEPSVSDELSVTYVTIPTAITATASPRQQFVGRDVTITGQLTASGVALAEVPVVLYNTDDPKKRVLAATTTTDASGYYQFTRTDSAATTHTYTICAEGDSTYSRAQSTEILVTYATRVEKPLAARVQTVFNLAWYELLSIFLILAGEGLVFAGYRVAGVGVQALNLVAIVGAIGVLKGERVELLEALALVSLLRVVNLSFAVIPTTTLSWLVAIYGVMFIPIIAVVVRRKLSRNDLGLTGGPQLTYLVPTGIIIGVGLALIEYQILANPALIPSYSLVGLVELSVVMIFVVTLVEQLIFRALLQPELIKRSGPMVGILITSIIFGAMQSGFANYYELLFAFGAGLVFGVAFYKTKNLPFVITMQAVNNIFLFGVLPFVPMLAVLR